MPYVSINFRCRTRRGNIGPSSPTPCRHPERSQVLTTFQPLPMSWRARIQRRSCDISRDHSVLTRPDSPIHDRRVSFSSLPNTEERRNEGAGFDPRSTGQILAAHSPDLAKSPTENPPNGTGDSVSGSLSGSNFHGSENLLELPLKSQLNKAFVHSAYGMYMCAFDINWLATFNIYVPT